METPAPNGVSPIIEMRGVDVTSAQSDADRVITGVSWRVAAGDYWVVGSLPGAGKSALLLTAAGVQRPGSGDLRLFGQCPESRSETEWLADRLRLSLVLESGGRLFSRMTVFENVALPYCYHYDCAPSAIADRVRQALELTELTEYAGSLPARLPRSLSPRVGLARGLVTRPEALLLDNPLYGLDHRQTRWWLDTLEALAAGHSFLGGRPLTLALTTDHFRPWLERGRQFAVIRQQQWEVLGGRAGLEQSDDAVVKERSEEHTSELQSQR